MPEKIKFPSELRFDLISGDWVIIATGRAKRPEVLRKKSEAKKESLKISALFATLKIKKRRHWFLKR